MFRKPHILMGLTLTPLVVSTVFIHVNLSRIMHKEMEAHRGQVRTAQRSQIVHELKLRIDKAWDIAEHYHHDTLGKEACKEILNCVNANDDGYLYVLELDTPTPGRSSLVVHPDENLRNTDTTRLIDMDRIGLIYRRGEVFPLSDPAVADIQPTDVAGKMREVCQKEGSGIIEYLWPRVVDGKASDIGYPKIAYVKYFEPWNWIIGSGAYADHIDALVQEEVRLARANAKRVWRLFMTSTLAVAIILGLVSLLVSSVFSEQIKRYEDSLLKSRENLRQEVVRSGRSEQVIKTLIHHLPQKVVLKNRNSVITYCNEKYAESLGSTVVETIGKTEYDFYPREVADGYLASDQEVIQLDKTIEMFSRRTVDGQEMVARVLKTPVKTDESHVDGVLCVFEDFSHRIHNEERLKAANTELEEANRRLKETQVQLVQSEKLASIGQLAAGIAHEINNPMCFVLGNVDLLQEYVQKLMSFLGECESCIEIAAESGDPRTAREAQRLAKSRDELHIDRIRKDLPELIEDSHEGMDRVLKIVRNLRSFSRIDQIEEIAPYDLNEGIRSTLVIAGNELNYKANVTTDLGDIPDVHCNAGQINQVLLNILVNAGQAIASQERAEMGHVVVRTYHQDNHVICTITDDGPGIPSENRTKIFDPFFTTKPVGQGTGLGLNVSYDIIVNKHGGELYVQSEPGQGATFTIKIPIEGKLVTDTQEEQIHEPQDSAVC